MADHQRVHPAQDMEAPRAPEAPLMPPGAPRSDKARPAAPMKPPKRRRSCLCRCLCWTVLLLLLQIVLVAAAAGVLYLVFRPKLPKYSVDRLQITRFEATGNGSLSAAADVTITARNPNEKIGIYYERGSRIHVWFAAAKLCEGALPEFYQGHENTTVLAVPLAGQADDGVALVSAVQAEQQRVGYVPLTLRVRQPVRIKLGKLKLFKIKFLVRCRLNVDSLSANNDIRIRNSSCKFRLRL